MVKRPGVRATCVAAMLLLAGCEPAENVRVQDLPPVDLPSRERRIGLPEMAGVWRFAGWVLPARDTASTGEGRVAPGEIHVATQRLDSVAGNYVREGAVFPFVGEVRRDSIFSVVVFDPTGAGSVVAGRVRRDTLWIELASLPSAAGWSAGTRVAMVRRPTQPPFTRFEGVAPRPDTVRADSLRPDSLRTDTLARPDSAAPAVPPAPGTVPAQLAPQPGVVPPARTAPPAATPPRARPAPPRTDTARPSPPPDTQPQPPRPGAPRDTLRLPPAR